MADRPPGFFAELSGDPMEIGSWEGLDNLEKVAEESSARTFEQQLEHASLYRQCFSSPAGRYVLRDLIDMFFRQDIVMPNDVNGFAPGIRQGQQHVVNRIFKMIEFANTGGGKPTGNISDEE
jgi:hypothetical protein